MRLFRKKKPPVVLPTPPEVLDSKQQLKDASDAVSTNTKKIKKILLADHVTLRIQVATHGGKHV